MLDRHERGNSFLDVCGVLVGLYLSLSSTVHAHTHTHTRVCVMGSLSSVCVLIVTCWLIFAIYRLVFVCSSGWWWSIDSVEWQCNVLSGRCSVDISVWIQCKQWFVFERMCYYQLTCHCHWIDRFTVFMEIVYVFRHTVFVCVCE